MTLAWLKRKIQACYLRGGLLFSLYASSWHQRVWHNLLTQRLPLCPPAVGMAKFT